MNKIDAEVNTGNEGEIASKKPADTGAITPVLYVMSKYSSATNYEGLTIDSKQMMSRMQSL
jgi:hypothetical protein